MTSRILWLLGSAAVTVSLILLWQVVVAARLISPIFFPEPIAVWHALLSGLNESDLGEMLLLTVYRMFVGWLLASGVGIALGVLIGRSAYARAALFPTLELIRPLPASAVVPLAITIFGLTEQMVIAVIIFGSVWPVLLATIHGVSTVQARLLEVAHVLRLSFASVVLKIMLPSALPDILAGMRLGLTAALILTVVGEMISSQPGLGQWILVAGRSFQAPSLFAGIVLLGIVGIGSGLVILTLDWLLLRWQRLRQ